MNVIIGVLIAYCVFYVLLSAASHGLKNYKASDPNWRGKPPLKR